MTRRTLAGFSALVVAAALLLATSPAGEAANPGDFRPGNIISDAVFYDNGAMSVGQIQSFLNSQVPQCSSGYTCLKDYRVSTPTKPADSYCRGSYAGSGSQSAAEIIWYVSQACGINPQVLLVLLQKEQSLVTLTAPSAGRYQAATGYGCPDTAPCAEEYYGFFNQVYRAARQFRVYQAFPGDFRHQPGQLNAVYFHPDVARCGAGNVFIENQATAGLYNYTPYQPNAAALSNLYGSGDGCSSYGNRNFWRLFTDWFGDPQGGSLVRTASDPQVFLVTEAARYTVSSAGLYSSLSAFGPVRVVPQSYLDGFTLRGEAGNLMRDPSSGAIFLVAYGQKNRFPTCDMIARWGFGASCGSYIDITQAQQYRLNSGADITQFARSSQTFALYHIVNGQKRALRTWDQVLAIADGGSTAYADFPQATLNLIPTGPDYLEPATMVRTATNPALYLVDGAVGAVRIDNGELISAFGLGPHVIVSDQARNAMTTASAPLTTAVMCGTDHYMAGGGSIWKVPATSGLTETTLDPATCAALTTAPQTVTGAIFLRNPATGAIYAIAGGKKTYMTSMDQINTLNGANPLIFIPSTPTVLASIPEQTQSLTTATLVKSASNPAVYLIDATKKIPIPSFALAAEYGITGYSTVSDSALSNQATAPMLTVAAVCGTDHYMAGGGSIWKVPATSGLTETTLDPATCAALTTAPQTVTGAIFLRNPATGAIYAIAGGKKTYMTSMDQINTLNGANPLIFIPSTPTVLASIPG
jgi:hypothetical protein